MFAAVIKKFDRYWDKMARESVPGFNEDLAIEVNKRLKQLAWLYKLIARRESKCLELTLREHRRRDRLRKELGITSGSITFQHTRDSRKIDRLMFEIELYTESFYYLAHRMSKILQHPSKPLPGLQSFECKGVRDARNKLLEHVEKKDSKIFAQSFGVGGEDGPTLKIDREPGQENLFLDKGIRTNAQEMCGNLARVLERQLA
jgi:hypothetical protein